MDWMSPITDFYAERGVFITGATGFLGKATVEKLLRSCSRLKAIYILIRPKSGKDVDARLAELLGSSLYETLRNENPDVLSKIIPISGDITQPHLGISNEDQELLVNEVSIVIHSAATVKFNEKLKVSINVNLSGTKRVVDLCKRMKNLVALVHVSSAYANCERSEISEQIYPPPVDTHKIIQSVEWMDDEAVNMITPQLIGIKPNTYTFTKALAEHILSEEALTLPISIVRPSIMTATWKEPVAGWIDNINGPTGLIVASGKGILRTLLCDQKKIADLIPLDFPVNLIIAAGWHTATARPGGIKVYNCCSGAENPLHWGDVDRWTFAQHITNPLNGIIWYPGTALTTSRISNYVNDFFVQYIPAYIMDTFAMLMGRKQVMLRLYSKLTKAVASLQFFTTHEWEFKTENMRELYENLSPEDQTIFNFDIKQVNWPNYIGKYCLGLRRHVLKEDASSLPSARIRTRLLYVIHRCTQLLFIMMFWRSIMPRSKTARNLWTYILALIVRIVRMLPFGDSC